MSLANEDVDGHLLSLTSIFAPAAARRMRLRARRGSDYACRMSELPLKLKP
jgi:hypothetical protein